MGAALGGAASSAMGSQVLWSQGSESGSALTFLGLCCGGAGALLGGTVASTRGRLAAVLLLLALVVPVRAWRIAGAALVAAEWGLYDPFVVLGAFVAGVVATAGLVAIVRRGHGSRHAAG